VERAGPDYAVVKVPGVLHFSIWSRAHAAESTFGSRDEAERVQLGFHVAFEVDDADAAAPTLGDRVVRGPKDEEWGQRTVRFVSPTGALCEVCTTPWARTLETDVTPVPAEVATS
jgi:catechol 2,3-dioxygenase-like lactoylglutathione lyase family enzyme